MEKFKTWLSNFWHKCRKETLITCKTCDIKDWVENELINRAPDRGIYCWECDIEREQIRNEKEGIERQKRKERTYCLDRNHNYLGVYNEISGIVERICSKCGREI